MDNTGAIEEAEHRSIGRYELLEKLFDADQGSYWACRDLGATGTPLVCLHEIPFSSKVKRPVGERLAQSWPWTAELQHGLILGIQDYRVGAAEITAVTPYVEGQPLGSLLLRAQVRRVTVPVSVALRIVLDVLEALSHLHAAAVRLRVPPQYVFGGLHPNSVLVGTDGASYLLEPGLAAAAIRESAWSQDLIRVGHTAPELVGQADQAADASTDLFAVGILFWELLQNSRLFGAPNLQTLVNKVQTQPVERVDAPRPGRNEGISASVADIVARALERDRPQRYRSAQAMAAAIQASGEAVGTHAEVAQLLSELVGQVVETRRTNIENACAIPPSPAALAAAAEPAPVVRAPAAEPAPVAAQKSIAADIADSLKPTEVGQEAAPLESVDEEALVPRPRRGRLIVGSVLGLVVVGAVVLWASGIAGRSTGAADEAATGAKATQSSETSKAQSTPAPSGSPTLAAVATTGSPTPEPQPTSSAAASPARTSATTATPASTAAAGRTAEPKAKAKPKASATAWNPDDG